MTVTVTDKKGGLIESTTHTLALAANACERNAGSIAAFARVLTQPLRPLWWNETVCRVAP